MSENPNYYSEEWVGKRYGHLEILSYANRNFVCLCDCGHITLVRPTFLISGRVKTCGMDCEHHLRRKGGISKQELYPIWYRIQYHCYNPNSPKFPEMQKRGIGMCDEWRNDFWAFNDWSEANGYQKGKCLTRIKKTIGYQPDNCVWVNKGEPLHRSLKFKTNYGVRYEIFGESLTMKEISDKYNLDPSFLAYRLKKGMTMEQAVTTPKYSNYTHTPAYLATHPPLKSEDVTMSTKEN